MIKIEEIINFIEGETGLDTLKEDSDIYEHGVSGDDFDELIGKYSLKYNVKMDSYLWYFHADEEGQNIGAIFFKPPNKRVVRIPITPMILLTFANKGSWEIDYPKHQLPKYRFDIIINQILFTAFLITMVYYFILKIIK